MDVQILTYQPMNKQPKKKKCLECGKPCKGILFNGVYKAYHHECGFKVFIKFLPMLLPLRH